jgi:hypothetical protein
MAKFSAQPSHTTAPADTDLLLIDVDLGGSVYETHKTAWPVLRAALGATNGWIPAQQTWTYASATTITVPAGAADIYSVGDKINILQGTWKYFYIVAVADTLLTVTGGSGYTVADAAISANYYSKSATPVGFPQWFNLTAPTWTTSANAFTNQPTGNAAVFNMIGKLVIVRGSAQCHATSGGTGVFVGTYTSAQLPISSTPSTGVAQNFSTNAFGVSYLINAFGGEIRMGKYDLSTLATNSEYFGFNIIYRVA